MFKIISLKFKTLPNSLSMVLTILVFFVFSSIQAQNDTVFFDAKWKITSREEASFFRPKIEKMGNLYKVEDYYISGKLQMRGMSSSKEKDIWFGLVTWYKENGKAYRQSTYANNRLDGEFISYDGDEKYIAYYKNGSFISGKMISDYGEGHFYQEKAGDTLVQVYYDGERKGIRYENYSTLKKGNYHSKYYGDGGKLIGDRTLLSNGYAKGVEVFYYYNPMRVQQIRYLPYGRELISATYYHNGQVREKVNTNGKWSKEYYSKSGELLGKIEYALDGDYLRPTNGKLIKFQLNTTKEYNGTIGSITIYSDGKIITEEVYNTNNKLTTSSKFENGFKSLQINFDDNGNEIHRMTFKNGLPLHGTEITKYHSIVYEDGELVEEIVFYRNTQKPQKKMNKIKEVYYDFDGNILGELKINFENGFSSPYEGKRFTLGSENGEVSGINEFKEGVLVKRTDFRKRLVAKDTYKTFKKIEEYDNNGYDKLREIRFYSNGQIQSDITYAKYKEVKGEFFDMQGEQLGVFDYKNKEGKLYKFFVDSNDIQLIDVYENGMVVSSKRYEMQRNVDYDKQKAILIHDFDITCCESFYSDETAELLGRVEYVNKKPWQGIAYSTADKTKYVIDQGKRNGDYVKYDYSGKIKEEGKFVNDKREGAFNYYNYIEVLKKTENYTNDILNGDVVYYNDEGILISKVEYKNGEPYNGTILLNTYSKRGANEESYEKGVLVKRITYGENGKNVTTYVNGIEDETVSYYPESDFIRLKYRSKNNYIDGDVIRYNEKGDQEYKANLKMGVLISGTILLTTNNYNNRVSYVKLTKSDEYIKTEVIDIDGIVIFEAKEKIILGSRPEYLERLNIVTKFIDSYHLY
ncbi:hypothetical protein [uncultured Maribacter sp.]|uniref:toxin-antitoxin system YwqK family antitoxin n=1 Tax=uncultured Maribacter sp. TaxID=431308 RepID=UPI0026109441|nr:hypothetical protein [uncultured Maribacter sp.]